MSVPTPKLRPISRVSLSVISHLCRLSATRSSSRGSSTPIRAAISRQIEVKEMAALEEVARAGHEQITGELRSQRSPVDETDRAGSHLELP